MTDILTVTDVENFIRQLIKEGTNAHPDEDFNNYININTELPSYTEKQAAVRNKLMNQCFDVCESVDEDIYDLMQEIYLKETGLAKFIPSRL